MPQVLFFIGVIGLAIWLAVMVVWIAAVFLMRVLGYVLGFSLIVAGAALLAGVIIGLVVPIRVLRGRGATSPAIASPDRVKAGKVFAAAPKGAAANFGWDYAWPLYVPYQLRLDQAEVVREARRIGSEIVWTARSWWFYPDAWYAKAASNLLWLVVFGLPTGGLMAGIAVGTFLWCVITGVLRIGVSLGQWVVLQGMRRKEARFTKRESASIRCVNCYRVSDMPSFRCSNPECAEVHRDVAPGRLGIRTRICGCGETLPLTVAGATGQLSAICPFCDSALPKGSGSRRVVVVPVFGSVGVGKTQFLATSAVSLLSLGETSASPFSVVGLSSAAEDFLRVSLDEAAADRAPIKTTHLERPEGYPFLIDRSDHPFELHLMDAAGENFVGAENSRALGYLDISETLVFLFDPLTIPEMGERLARSGTAGQVQIAQGSGSAAYGSVVDRLRDGGQSLTKKHLAVVLTKADIVAEVFPQSPVPADSPGIREWLYSNGEDALVRRIELDFLSVTYFAVDSTDRKTGNLDTHPVRVVDWSLCQQGGSTLFPESAPLNAERAESVDPMKEPAA